MEWSPLYNSQFCAFPRVTVIEKLQCSFTSVFLLLSIHYICYFLLFESGGGGPGARAYVHANSFSFNYLQFQKAELERMFLVDYILINLDLLLFCYSHGSFQTTTYIL